MPLPDSSVEWPPRPLQPVFGQLAVWSAWYSGNPDELSNVYESTGNKPNNRPSQYRGGIVGALSRMFWGRPVPDNEPKTKLHIPLAADIAAKSADLLYTEPPALDFGENTGAAARMEQAVFDGLYATLLEGAEVGAGLGGHYLRIVWDPEIAELPWIVAVHHDAAVPEWKWGRLWATTFWETVAADGTGDTVLRHLERHERGSIQHGLYEGSASQLGQRIDLAAHSSTADIVGEVVDDKTLIIDTKVPDRLTASYVPNMVPNRLWRNIPEAAPMGRSDFAGLEGELDALDETWTSWMRDIRIGKGRMFVPQYMLESLGTGKSAAWNAEAEIFTGLNMPPSKDGDQLTAKQFEIRVDEHQRTAAALTEQIIRSARYSPTSFGIGADGQAVTATEIRAAERQSFITQGRKARYTRAPLAEIIETLLAVDAALFGQDVEPEKPAITFADSISEAPEVTARTVQLLETARAISTETKVRMVHPDWEKEEIDAEVKRITDEQGIGAKEDPAVFGGSRFGTGNEAEPPEDEAIEDDDAPTDEAEALTAKA